MQNKRRYPRARLVVAGAVLSTLVIAGPASTGPTLGGLASDNVTYVTTVPFEAGGALTGARVVGDHLYVAGARSFSIYDVSVPAAPELLSVTPTGPQFPNEDVDTNGEILLVSNEVGATLQVWDVENKATPALLAEVEDVDDHTFTCVLDCSWAYGSRGAIVDLRDPASPRLASFWGAIPNNDGFDATEVAPGMILTATRTIRLLDARREPAEPRLVAQAGTSDNRLIHSLRWPNGGRDRFFLVQGETPFSRFCNDESGAFMTWDTRNHRRTRSFRLVDEYRVTNGNYADGNPPAGAAGCTAMWFQEHPTFRNGGLVASAFFEHGARFLEVDPKGQISELGYFLPAGGETIATYWVSDEIVYAIDTVRGIDVLRFDG